MLCVLLASEKHSTSISAELPDRMDSGFLTGGSQMAVKDDRGAGTAADVWSVLMTHLIGETLRKSTLLSIENEQKCFNKMCAFEAPYYLALY